MFSDVQTDFEQIADDIIYGMLDDCPNKFTHTVDGFVTNFTYNLAKHIGKDNSFIVNIDGETPPPMRNIAFKTAIWLLTELLVERPKVLLQLLYDKSDDTVFFSTRFQEYIIDCGLTEYLPAIVVQGTYAHLWECPYCGKVNKLLGIEYSTVYTRTTCVSCKNSVYVSCVDREG